MTDDEKRARITPDIYEVELPNDDEVVTFTTGDNSSEPLTIQELEQLVAEFRAAVGPLPLRLRVSNPTLVDKARK